MNTEGKGRRWLASWDQAQPVAALLASALTLWPLFILGLIMISPLLPGGGGGPSIYWRDSPAAHDRQVWLMGLGLGAVVALFGGGIILLGRRPRIPGYILCIAGLATGSPIVIYLIMLGGHDILLSLLYLSPTVIAMTTLSVVLIKPFRNSAAG